jgi:glycine betaine/proline transport system substrate-binding protein
MGVGQSIILVEVYANMMTDDRIGGGAGAVDLRAHTRNRAAVLGRTVVLGVLLVVGGATAAAACETDLPIAFADLDWDSNRVHTEIAAAIAELGFGCETTRVPAGTTDGVEMLADGAVDVMMEVWADNVADVWLDQTLSGNVVDANINFDDGRQGWFVPRYAIAGDPARGIAPAVPGLKSVADLADAWPAFRDPDNPDKCLFANCVRTWGCRAINSRKLAAYGLAERYVDRVSASGKALDDFIVDAFGAGRPFLVYYWGPNWILGAYDLVQIEEPPYDPDAWAEMLSSERPARATAYPVSEVHIGISAALETRAPEYSTMLVQYAIDSRKMSALLARMKAESLTPAGIARVFLREHQEDWRRWMPEAFAEKVVAAVRAGK